MGSLAIIAVIPKNTWAADGGASGMGSHSILQNLPRLGPPGNTLPILGFSPLNCDSLSQNYGRRSAILSPESGLFRCILQERKDEDAWQRSCFSKADRDGSVFSFGIAARSPAN